MDPKDFELLAKELNVPEASTEEKSLRDLYSSENNRLVAAWLHEQGRLIIPGRTVSDESIQKVLTSGKWSGSGDEADALLDVVDTEINRSGTSPWTSKQIPPLAQWLVKNEAAMDLIVEASHRSRYYSPSPSLLNKEHDLLMVMPLNQLLSIRSAARALPVRAMWNMGEGRPMEAWQDLFAIHHLANLLTEGNSLVDQLVAIAISGIACDRTLTFLDQGQLTSDQAKQVQRDLASLPNFSALARTLDKGERLQTIDTLVHFASEGGFKGLLAGSGSENDFRDGALDSFSVDWNVALRDTNACYDRLVAAASLPSHTQRTTAITEIENEVTQMGTVFDSPWTLIASVANRQNRSKLVSGLVLNYLFPSLRATMSAEDRANGTLELTRVAAALAVYRAEHGAYPEKLVELVPSVLDKRPVDLFDGKPIIYERFDDGYLLYSTGDNGQDDHGSNEQMSIFEGRSLDDIDTSNSNQPAASQIPTGADDISIRVPRPQLKSTNDTNAEKQ